MLLRDEQTANIVLENTGVCSAHTQNSLTHARAHSNLCWISFIFKSKEKKKSHHRKRHHVSSVHPVETVGPTSCDRINKNSQRGVSLIRPSGDLQYRTEGVVVVGLTGFLWRHRRGHQSCLARKEPIPQRTAPAAPSLQPTSPSHTSDGEGAGGLEGGCNSGSSLRPSRDK